VKGVRVLRQEIFELPADGIVDPAGEYVTVDWDNVSGVIQFRSEDWADRFRGFLQEGRRGVYAIADGEVVGHAWATVNRGGETINGYFRGERMSALIHDCNVAPKARGRGVYKGMIQSLGRAILAEGVAERVLIDTSVTNVASRSGIVGVGGRKVGWGLYLQVMNFTVFRLQSLAT